MKQPLLLLLFAGIYFTSPAQQFTLIKDINPGAGSSNICYLTTIDNNVFFAANNGANGMELWKSDGTDAGTVIVKDINNGAASSSIGYLTNVNRTLFFVANNGTNGTELWKSDGTTAGTVMVKDIRAGSLGSNPSSLVNLNGVLFFAADNGINGVELWKSDGTAAGTVMVKDISSPGSSYPQSIASVDGILYFAAYTSASGMELWKSDGTAAGTVLVKDIRAGGSDSYPFEITAVGTTIYFSATNGTNGTELWKSDGTAAGTVMVKDIWPGAGEGYPFSLRSVNGTLFFTADNGSNGMELWKTDGTTAGTTLVKDVWPGQESGATGNFTRMVNKLLFTGNDGVSGYKTWQSDGSAAGTQIASISAPENGNMQELVETGSKIYASIQQTEVGRELWAFNFSQVLPVDFTEFTGRLAGNDGLLNWKTANEVNTTNFDIERSTNGAQYTTVGKVKANNTAGFHSYKFTDPSIISLGVEKIYYRLKQVDELGRITYSRVVMLPLKTTQRFAVYPVPARSELNVAVSVGNARDLEYMVIDNGGRVVMRDSKSITGGPSNFAIPVDRLSTGVYYLNIRTDDSYERIKFIKD